MNATSRKLLSFSALALFLAGSCASTKSEASKEKSDTCWQRKVLYCESSHYCKDGCSLELWSMIAAASCDEVKDGLLDMRDGGRCLDGECGKVGGLCGSLVPSDADRKDLYPKN